MNAITQQSQATPGQLKQINRFGSDAIDKVLEEVGLDNPGAQRVIEHGNEFSAGIREAAIQLIKNLSVTDQFASEEVESSYTYPKEYRGPKPIGAQVDILAKEFGLSLGYVSEFIEKTLPTMKLPQGAEGWFAIPSVDAVAKRFFPEVTDPAEKYCRAIDLVLEKLGKSRNFYNYREGETGNRYLKQSARTLHALDLIAEGQNGDILIVPVQYGMRHRGRSVRRARECFTANEFGLGAFALGCMALVHPERYVRWEQLHTDCAGDEYAPLAVGDFSKSPLFIFSDGVLEFGTGGVSDAFDDFGSVSAFVPQG